MSTPRTSAPTPEPFDAARFATLETKVGSIGETLEAFVAESKEYRLRSERTETQIWAAIREQGERMNSAVEKLSNNGRISWGMIVSTGGFILALIVAGAGVNYSLTEARVRQIEIRQEYMQREADRAYTERRDQIRDQVAKP
jgi:hypothetical protein